MWQLMMTNATKEWVHAGNFETVKAAAGRIRDMEGYPVTGVFFQILVETDFGTDDEFFGHLEHTGRNTKRCYVVKRRMN